MTKNRLALTTSTKNNFFMAGVGGGANMKEISTTVRSHTVNTTARKKVYPLAGAATGGSNIANNGKSNSNSKTINNVLNHQQ